MAKREISIVLKAKNELQIGLAKAKSALEGFGSSVLSVGKWAATAFAAAGAAVIGFGAKALSSFAEAQAAEVALRNSFMAFGEEVDVNTAKVNKFAEAIHKETGINVENIKTIATQLKMQGAQTNSLELMTKAVVALTSAGMSQEAATKAAILAQNGNYQSLTNLIPQLKLAGSEQEKLAIIQSYLSRQYDAQKAQLNTVGGQWNLLKDRANDLFTIIGSGIATNDTFARTLAFVNNKALELGDAIKSWIANGGIENFKALFLMTLEEVNYRIQVTILYVKAFWESFRDSSVTQWFGGVLGSLVNAAIENFSYLAEYAVAIWEKIKNPLKSFEPPDFTPAIEATKIYLQNIIGAHIEERDSTSKTLSEIENLRIKHNEKIAEISDQQLSDLLVNNQKQLENSRIAQLAIVDANKQASSAIIAIDQEKTLTIANNNQQRVANEKESLDQIVALNQDAVDKIAKLESTDSLFPKNSKFGMPNNKSETVITSSASNFGQVFRSPLTTGTGSFSGAVGIRSSASAGSEFSGSRAMRDLYGSYMPAIFSYQNKSLDRMANTLEDIRRDNQLLLRYR